MSDASVASAATTVLPEAASHSYLGEGQVSGDSRSVLNPGQLYNILLHPLPDVVLYPGQTIPLRINDASFIQKYLTLRARPAQEYEFSTHIGIVTIHRNRRDRPYRIMATAGTTMEVRSTHRRASSDSELVVSGQGRHRFRVVSCKSESGVPVATVEILSDEMPGAPYLDPRSNPFPEWVYEVNSPRRLARIAYSLFEATMLWTGGDTLSQRWGLLRPMDPDSSVWSLRKPRFSEYEAEKSPVQFSFFLCANMAVESSLLQAMLEAKGVMERLRLAIALLRDGLHKKLACNACGQVLADKQDIFNVTGAEGLSSVFVNRHGAVHQTLTVRKLLSSSAIRLSGRPSTQDTWFPGYAWTIMSCSRCYSHLGWRYTWVGTDADESISTDSRGTNDDEDFDNDDSDMSDEDDEYDDGSYETVSDGMEEQQDVEENDDQDSNEESAQQSFSTTDPPTLDVGEGDDVPHNRSVSEDAIQIDCAVDSCQPNSTVLKEFWGLTRSAIRDL